MFPSSTDGGYMAIPSWDDIEDNIEDEIVEETFLVSKYNDLIVERSKAAGLEAGVAEAAWGNMLFVDYKNGREHRRLTYSNNKTAEQLLGSNFEDYFFVSDYEAICSYKDCVIEALIRPLGPGTYYSVRRMLFGGSRRSAINKSLKLTAPKNGFPSLEIGPPSNVFAAIYSAGTDADLITLRFTDTNVSTQEEATQLLIQTANSLLFQLELVTDLSFTIAHRRVKSQTHSRVRPFRDNKDLLTYPRREYDQAPIQLYWYARGASALPLLQFLAFYQVIEFYFPVHSRAEASRRVRAVLKDPTFRPHRDSDVARLLTSIRIGRNGAFGSEVSQLKSTITECVSPDDLKAFIEADPTRKEYLVGGGKSSFFHKISLKNTLSDIINDVAARLYQIRCRIVHTKGEDDTSDDANTLLLPNSKEAKQMQHDIEIVRFLSQKVLVFSALQLDI